MAAIASLSLDLLVKLDKWGTGLKSAENSAVRFSGNVASVGAQAGKALAPVVSAAAQAAAGLAGLGVAAVAAGAAMASAGLDRIDALSDAAQRLGVTTDSLSELRYAAALTGSSAEDLDAALEKLNTNLGDAAQKATPTGEALARLGLDARKLAQAGPAEAFKAIVGGFSKIPNAAERASLAMDLFGKGGIRILNTLGSGTGTLAELGAEARRFGASIGQVDAAKVGAAKDALDRAGFAVQGLGNVLAVELAPLVDVTANAFAAWLGDTVTGAGKVQQALGGVAKGVGGVGDVISWAEKQAQYGIANLIDFQGDLFGKEGKEYHVQAAEFRKDIEKSFAVKPSTAIANALDAIRKKSNAAAEAAAVIARGNLGAGSSTDGLGKSIADVTAKLKEQADTFGKTAAEVEIFKLAQMGATQAQLADARASAKKLEGLEARKKSDEELKASARSLYEGSLTAAQKYESELGKIAKARAAGLIDDATAGRARGKAAGEAGLDQPAKFAGAARLGSAEAYSAIVAATTTTGGGDGIKDVAKSSTRTAGNTARIVEILGKVANFLGQPAPTIPL